MFKTRITVLLASACLACSSAFAFDVITVNGAKATSDSVLARLKNQNSGRVHALSVGDAQIAYRSELVPGLLSLKRANAGEIHALSNDQKAAALLKWIAELQATGQFEYVEPDYMVYADRVPSDLRFADGTLWGLQNFGQAGGTPGMDISVTNAWDLTVGSTNVVVAVVDTGVRYTHRDLAAQMWHNPREIPGNGLDDDNDGFVDDIFGADFIDNDADPNDEFGHGTHVAGTIAAAANDGNPHVGVAWKVQIMAVRVLGSDGSGTSSGLAAGLQYAGNHGAKIVNLSLGGLGFSSAAFDAVNALRSKGVLVVCAAGNDGVDNDITPHYPASFDLDNIISVAAMDRHGFLASFSDFGKISVDVAAPGVEIFSTYFRSDTDYQFLDGTSMATPHVAGVAALVASFVPGASYQEIRSRILDGAVPVASFASKIATGGRVSAFRALTRGIDGILEYSLIPPTNSFLTLGEATVFSLSLSDGPAVTNATVNLSGSGTNLALRYDKASNTVASLTAGTYTNTFIVPNFESTLNFTLTATAPGKTNLSVPVTYQAVARPGNDKFVNAIKVPQQSSITYTTSNRLATIEGPVEQNLNHGGATNASASIWYAWSLPQRTSVIVDTAGSTFDTVIGVYQGTTLTNLEPVAQADNVGSRREAWVKFIAEPNVSYKIAIAGVPPSDQGLVQVRFEVNGEPDTVAPVVQINSPVSGLTVLTNKITVQGSAFDPKPNASGLQQAGVQFVVSINQQVNPNALPESAQGTTNWTAPVTLQQGINFVTVWAFDNAENRSRNQQIALIYQPLLTVNDLFIQALPLTGTQGSFTNSNANASKEFGEPPHGGNAGGRSIWYKFTSAQSGVFLVNTRGSTNTSNNLPLDTVMSVYVSTNTAAPKVTTLDQLASNDDVAGAGTFSEIALTVEAGKTYYVAVDGYDAAPGNVQLNYTFSPATVYQVTILPPSGNGTVSPRSGPFPANATLSVVAKPGLGAAFQYFLVGANQVKQNPLTLVVTGSTTVQAVFGAHTFAEDFEGPTFKLPFLRTNWSITLDPTNRFNHVLQSQGNGLNSVTNIASVVLQSVRGTGGFDYGTSTETNYDRLEFYITAMLPGQPTNTVFLGSWSGETRGRYEFDLPAGAVRLEWRYLKDRAISAGRDLVFIDNIDLPQAAGVSALSVENQTTSINVKGGAGQAFLIESSNDLTHWVELGTESADENGDLSIAEPEKGDRRFYRFTPIQPATP